MEFVCNANYRGHFKKPINLREFHKLIPNSKVHTKPFQLVIKDLKGTLILFSNGKFRTMGCIDELEASILAWSYLEKLTTTHFHAFPYITLQSYTLKCHIGFRVNLEKLRLAVPCIYEPELFPALRLNKYKPTSVNVVTTAKVMICGVKNSNEIAP